MIEELNNTKTVDKNKNAFRGRQYKISFKNNYHMIGAPTLQNLKIMIRKNMIQNFPFTFGYFEK